MDYFQVATAPALSWDGMLNMKKLKLELIPDPDMCIFSEKVTKAEISYISNRQSKANKKRLKSYDPKQESQHIIYLDRNGLYGYAMYKLLPKIGFK